jgi:diguanylate cyclase (GGDEF)-like protein
MSDASAEALLEAVRELSTSLRAADVGARLLGSVLVLAGASGAALALEARGESSALELERGDCRGTPLRVFELAARGESLGRLHVFARGDPDEASLRALVAHGAIALSNARDHEQALVRADRDALTGLANHGHLWAALERETARADRYGRDLAFVMIDVDRFKAFNDRHGHLAGDAALAQIARLVQERSRNSDTAGRYGGDEFALVLPETTILGAIAVAEKIRTAAEALRPDGADVSLTLSFGVASAPRDGKTAADLVRAADARLYRAKASGGNLVIA